MTRHLSIDIETYSSVDLKKAGMHRYVQSPDFEIMLLAYSWDYSPVDLIDLTQQSLPLPLAQALADPAVIKHAYNAAFEYTCLSKFLPTPLSSWRCTQMHGLYCGYPMGLGNIGAAMGIPSDLRKLNTGRALIRTFCVPCKPSRTNGYRSRTLPQHEPERWELFKSYCKQDVVAEMDIARRLAAFPVPASEQYLWELDIRMNTYGVAVDRNMIEGALHCNQVTTDRLMAEAIELSGLSNPKSVKQLKAWLQEELDLDEELPDLTKATVRGLLQLNEDNPIVTKMLRIRQELCKTSVTKYAAMATSIGEDGRIRGLLQHYGANRTGRWAGRLVQVQNLPQNHLKMLDLARRLTVEKQLPMMQFVFGNVPDTLSQLVRTAFVASPGNRLLVADFNAIEARILSWLAGEEWRMQVFATHGKIYEASAAQMFGVPVHEITKASPLRQKGKVAELALGYQGGKAALIKMGALSSGLSEDELPEIVGRWRNTNKRIVEFWYAIDGAAVRCMQTGQPQLLPHGIAFRRESSQSTGQDFLVMQLPSGRSLYYAHPVLVTGNYGRPQIEYMGMNQTTKNWESTPTYGGKLTENMTQAIARDCLALCIVRALGAGYPIVMHVHDEVIVDAPPALQLQPLLDIMAEPIPWAPGLLLKGAGFECDYYQKD